MNTDDDQATQDRPLLKPAAGADKPPQDRQQGRDGREDPPPGGNPPPGDGIPKWQQWIWVGCSIGLMLMIVALCFIVVFALSKIMLLLEIKDRDHLFQFAGMNLVTGNLLRLLAILIGGAIAFVGLAVSFFAHQKATSMESSIAKNELLNAKAALATYSPGIIAIVIGSVVIMASIYARGTYNYRPASVSNQGANLPPEASSLPDPKVFQDDTEEKNARPSRAPAPRS
jgi:hypothetical protein